MPGRKRENCINRGGRRPVLLFLLVPVLVVLCLCARMPIGDNVSHEPLNADILGGQQAGKADKWPSELSADNVSIFLWDQYRRQMEEAARQIRVAVYSTHSSESYTASGGAAKLYGELGGVYRASDVMAQRLRSAGIGVVVDETIHDWPDWNKAYSNSLETARRLLKTYTELDVLIDMHRDAGVSRENSIVNIDGKTAARLLLVVGSNQRYEHDNWRQNEAFSQRIADLMDEMYPGLLRRVSVQSGRYNQHISPKAILVEMGTTENSIGEVEYSARLLANVLQRLLEDEADAVQAEDTVQAE